MFTKHHYDWLARWAGENLSERDCANLSAALNNSNANFNASRFMSTCVGYRNAKTLVVSHLERRRASGAI